MQGPWQHVMETKSSHQLCQQEGRDKGQRCYRRTLQKGSIRLSDLLYVGIKEGKVTKSHSWDPGAIMWWEGKLKVKAKCWLKGEERNSNLQSMKCNVWGCPPGRQRETPGARREHPGLFGHVRNSLGLLRCPAPGRQVEGPSWTKGSNLNRSSNSRWESPLPLLEGRWHL